MLLTEIVTEELQVLTEVLPGSHRIGVMWEPNTPSHRLAVNALQGTGDLLRINLLFQPTSTADEFDTALQTFRRSVQRRSS